MVIVNVAVAEKYMAEKSQKLNTLIIKGVVEEDPLIQIIILKILTKNKLVSRQAYLHTY